MTKRKQFTKSQRKAVWDKTGGHCAYCGCLIELRQMQIDHVTPLRKGGTNDFDNLLPACRSCNHYKDTFTVEQFRANIAEIPRVLVRDSASYRTAKRYGIIKESNEGIIFYFERHTAAEE